MTKWGNTLTMTLGAKDKNIFRGYLYSLSFSIREL